MNIIEKFHFFIYSWWRFLFFKSMEKSSITNIIRKNVQNVQHLFPSVWYVRRNWERHIWDGIGGKDSKIFKFFERSRRSEDQRSLKKYFWGLTDQKIILRLNESKKHLLIIFSNRSSNQLDIKDLLTESNLRNNYHRKYAKNF